MEFLNDLRGTNSLGHERVGGREETIAMIPDRLTFRWWRLFCVVAVGNILLWSLAAWGVPWESDLYRSKQLVLSGLFVAACAFRSLLPRVDLERMCLWDSPLSSVMVGRTVATIAELCCAWQCALLLFKLSALTGSSVIDAIGLTVLPIIVVAELACWCAVATLNHIWHAVEELLWPVMVGLVAAGLVLYWKHTAEAPPMWVPIGLLACAGTAALIGSLFQRRCLGQPRHHFCLIAQGLLRRGLRRLFDRFDPIPRCLRRSCSLAVNRACRLRLASYWQPF